MTHEKRGSKQWSQTEQGRDAYAVLHWNECYQYFSQVLEYVIYSVCRCGMNLLRSPSAAFQPDILVLTEAAMGVLAASKLCCYYSLWSCTCWFGGLEYEGKRKKKRDLAAQIAVRVQPELCVQRLMLCVQDRGCCHLFAFLPFFLSFRLSVYVAFVFPISIVST